MGVRMLVRGVVAAVAAVTTLAASFTPIAASASDADTTTCAGVRVLVDANELGGDEVVGCAGAGAGTAAAAFAEAGIELEFLPTQPGFVCRVAARPAQGPCFAGDAYWSLWWTDGSSPWTYATLGVTSLEIPAGGAVAFAWHEGAGEAHPPDRAVDELLDTPSAGGGAAARAGGSDEVDGAAEGSGAEDGNGLPWPIVAAVAVVLLGAAVPFTRRRPS